MPGRAVPVGEHLVLTFLREPVFQSRSQILNSLTTRWVLNLLQNRHTSHGRRRVVLAEPSPGFQAISFSRVSDDPVGCVGCERDKVGVELYNEIIDLVDLVLLFGAFSKDIHPGYHAVSLRKSATFDNDFTLT